MPNPSKTTRRAEARNLETLNSSLPQHLAPVQVLKAQSPHFSLQAEERSLIEIKPCLGCGSTLAIIASGKGPHFAALRCAICDRFLKWLPKPGGATNV